MQGPAGDTAGRVLQAVRRRRRGIRDGRRGEARIVRRNYGKVLVEVEPWEGGNSCTLVPTFKGDY